MVIQDVIDIAASSARHTDVARDDIFCSRLREEYMMLQQKGRMAGVSLGDEHQSLSTRDSGGHCYDVSALLEHESRASRVGRPS